ncbi:unnamed protein product [Mytilus edulis]|uniref:Nephrocystin 3-like N-terminal domain-containing protein n=1 Tax=Mytilus edulis TaxID=6550 RepID=A0A8S3R2K7_MYTED|nr:unnamed protein product [Mytilus edulis]
MAVTRDIVNKDNLDNYVSVLLGLRYIVNGLQDFVTDKLRNKQMEIKQKCTLGRCQLNCSRKYQKINFTKSGKNALHCIETLRLCPGLPNNILQTQEGRLALIDIRNEIHNGSIDRNIIYLEAKLEERLQQMTGLLNKNKKHFSCLRPSPKNMEAAVHASVFFHMFILLVCFKSTSKESPKGCLSMQFKNDWNIDSLVDFNFYVENLHNQSTVSRSWLFGKIHEELATSEKGIILTAEMGYGKSSIISNLVCADKSSDWYDIRKNVLAYHFCRYDSIRSTNAGHFIRNIASAIVDQYPELGNSILSDDNAS